MKYVIFIIFFFIGTLSLSKENIDLEVNGNGFYSKPFLSGKILFSPKRYPAVLLSMDYSIFDSDTFIYNNELDNFFHVNTEVFISLLQHNNFKNSDFFYFLVADSTRKNHVKKTFF